MLTQANAARYCEEKGAPLGSEAHYSLLGQPPLIRSRLTALYALFNELQSIANEVQDEGIAARKRAFWREEIAALFAEQPRHPVTVALAPHLSQVRWESALFNELLDGMEMDANYDAYPSYGQLALYVHRLGSTAAILIAESTGYTARNTMAFAHEIGAALLLWNRLKELAFYAKQGRFYIPEDEIHNAGVQISDFTQIQRNERLQKLLAQQAERIEKLARNGLTQLALEDRMKQLPLLILLRLEMALLSEYRREGFRFLEQKQLFTPLYKLWLAWRVRRKTRLNKPIDFFR